MINLSMLLFSCCIYNYSFVFDQTPSYARSDHGQAKATHIVSAKYGSDFKKIPLKNVVLTNDVDIFKQLLHMSSCVMPPTP